MGSANDSSDSNVCWSRMFKMVSLVDSLWFWIIHPTTKRWTLIGPSLDALAPHHAYVAPRWRKAWMTTDRKCSILSRCERVSPHKPRSHLFLSSSTSSLSSQSISKFDSYQLLHQLPQTGQLLIRQSINQHVGYAASLWHSSHL